MNLAQRIRLRNQNGDNKVYKWDANVQWWQLQKLPLYRYIYDMNDSYKDPKLYDRLLYDYAVDASEAYHTAAAHRDMSLMRYYSQTELIMLNEILDLRYETRRQRVLGVVPTFDTLSDEEIATERNEIKDRKNWLMVNPTFFLRNREIGRAPNF